MYTLVLFVCWLDAGCKDLAIDHFKSEQSCLYAMSDQRIRNGGCYPTTDVIGTEWQPASEYSDL